MFAIAVLGLMAWYVLRKRRVRGNVQETDADVNPQTTTPVVKNVAWMYKMEEMQPGPTELPLNVKRSELDGSDRSGRERGALVDERAAAGYDRAYRGN